MEPRLKKLLDPLRDVIRLKHYAFRGSSRDTDTAGESEKEKKNPLKPLFLG